MVKGMAKGIVTIADNSSMLIETDYILHNPVSVTHPKIFEFIFSITDGIKGAKIGSEFRKESGIGVCPGSRIGVVRMEDIWFEPVEGHTGKEGNSIVDFGGVCTECVRPVIEVQLQGNDKRLQFPWVRAVEHVRLLDLGADWTWRRVSDLVGQAAEEIHEIHHEVGVIRKVVRGRRITTRSAGTAGTARATWVGWTTGRTVGLPRFPG